MSGELDRQLLQIATTVSVTPDDVIALREALEARDADSEQEEEE